MGRSAAENVVLNTPSVSRRHFLLDVDFAEQVRIADAGSHNGTTADGALVPTTPVGLDAAESGDHGRCGHVRRPAQYRGGSSRRPGLPAAGRAGRHGPFNRPPREGQAGPPAPISVPKEPGQAEKPTFSVASLLGPLALAGAMVAATGNARYALISALAPFLAVGTYYESRRRGTRSRRRAVAEYDTAVAGLRERVRQAAAVERTRLRAPAPDPAEALRRAALPSVHLWSGGPDPARTSPAARRHRRPAVAAAGHRRPR